MLHHKPLIPRLISAPLQEAGERLAKTLTANSQGWEEVGRRRRGKSGKMRKVRKELGGSQEPQLSTGREIRRDGCTTC